jgi:hypothetical protein
MVGPLDQRVELRSLRSKMNNRGPFGFEAKHHPVLSRVDFAKRMVRSLVIAVVMIGVSLLAGVCGYHFLENLSWIDAFLNASMILAGMGPVDTLKTEGGKLFAGCYALYSGLVVIATAGVLLMPVVHRMLHKFHAETEKGVKDGSGA